MDIVTYKLAQKYANKVAASFSSVRVDGLDIIFTLNDGKTATVTVPAPKDGKDGVDGQDGKSAYEVWLDEGNVGTEEDFLESIKGDKGEQRTKAAILDQLDQQEMEYLV